MSLTSTDTSAPQRLMVSIRLNSNRTNARKSQSLRMRFGKHGDVL